MRPDSLLRLWRYINHLLTYLLVRGVHCTSWRISTTRLLQLDDACYNTRGVGHKYKLKKHMSRLQGRPEALLQQQSDGVTLEQSQQTASSRHKSRVCHSIQESSLHTQRVVALKAGTASKPDIYKY